MTESQAIGKLGREAQGGSISKSIERSATNLALEFVGLIKNKKALLQANAKVISTTDELLESVTNF